MQITEIANGVRLCYENTDRFKTCRISITMAMPLDQNASARAILPFMLSRRCAKYPDMTSLNRALDELYGASISCGVGKRGEAQYLSFNLTAIDDRFALDGDKVALECVDLLTDMIFKPLIDGEKFPDNIIEQEKRLLVEIIENEMNDKRHYALSRCESFMFENEAYSRNRYGTVEDVNNLNSQDVYDAWAEELSQAVIQITMIGSMDAEPVADLLKKRFSNINRHPVSITTEFITATPKPEYVCEKMPLKQGKLVMGFRTGMRDENDNAVAMRVAADIFGGGTYSKLFSVVREKMSLCYYCSAALNTAKGIIMVQSGIEDVNEEKAKTEIIHQLSLVAQGEFSDDDISASIKSISDSVIGYNDTPESICAWYSAQIFRDKIIKPEDYAEQIVSVDRQQVVRAAKTIMLDTVYMLKSDGEGSQIED